MQKLPPPSYPTSVPCKNCPLPVSPQVYHTKTAPSQFPHRCTMQKLPPPSYPTSVPCKNFPLPVFPQVYHTKTAPSQFPHRCTMQKLSPPSSPTGVPCKNCPLPVPPQVYHAKTAPSQFPHRSTTQKLNAIVTASTFKWCFSVRWPVKGAPLRHVRAQLQAPPGGGNQHLPQPPLWQHSGRCHHTASHQQGQTRRGAIWEFGLFAVSLSASIFWSLKSQAAVHIMLLFYPRIKLGQSVV